MTGLALQIVRESAAGVRVLHTVPIVDDAEAAEAARWVDSSRERWETLGEGRLRRAIVPAGGDR